MAAQTAGIALSVIAHALLFYVAGGVSLPEPHTERVIHGKLSITVTQRTPLPYQEPITTVPQPPKTRSTEENHTKTAATAHNVLPQQKKPTSTQAPAIAQSQPEVRKKQSQIEQTAAVAFSTPQQTSSKPVTHSSVETAEMPQHAAIKIEQHVAAKENHNITPPSVILEIESNYTTALLKEIERHRRYPLRARRRGDEGEVLIEFTILEDGEVTGIQVASSSHSSSLDQAASKALEQLRQFKPIPQQLQRTSWDFRIPVRFALN